MRCLITGTAGFVGYHVAKRLLQQGHEVTGIDGMTPYYDVKLKEDRHALLEQLGHFRAHRCMLEDAGKLQTIAEQSAPELVIHLAAQAGVRHSLENPRAYVDSNIVGSFNILEICRELRPRHLVIASTSSVYGARTDFPLAETDRSDHVTVFRFFNAYGPWGRPDMALFKFVQNILAGHPIDIYNHGNMERDFTYVDDLVESVIRLSELEPKHHGNVGIVDTDSSSPVGPYRIVNIGGGHPVSLLTFIEEIERTLGQQAKRNYMDMQMGDASRTEASTEFLEALIGYRPATPISVGIGEFVRWYREYYGV